MHPPCRVALLLCTGQRAVEMQLLLPSCSRLLGSTQQQSHRWPRRWEVGSKGEVLEEPTGGTFPSLQGLAPLDVARRKGHAAVVALLEADPRVAAARTVRHRATVSAAPPFKQHG